ncbi:MAG TPA: 1-deoxy-D-xylulose-5-phosphate reductoisomerase [Clostridiales bacterium]|nr:1-deoxy-D-xylulose-5-phosphate reductoisomerase [Clostridiales bacterium]
MQSVVLLGSTGSIGKQTLEVLPCIHKHVEAISGNENVSLLENQIRAHSPRFCAVGNEKAARDLQLRVADTNCKLFVGNDGICEMISRSVSPLVVNALLGRCGIRPTLVAMEHKKNVAMANKEPIVAAGDFLLKRAKEEGVMIIPVDSEHSAIFQCLDTAHNHPRFIRRLILTASGGPFFGKNREDLVSITPAQAVTHPTWNMGKKISVDSATLMNKGLELIEAVRLFGVDADCVEVTVHRQSIVHSMVEFTDASVLAQLGHPDMRHCIQFALTYPERCESLCKPMDFTDSFSLTFQPVDENTFSLLPLARHAVKRGGTAPAVMNAANEAAVALFLENKLSFTDIFDLVTACTVQHKAVPVTNLDMLEQVQDEAAEFILNSAFKRR